MAMVTVKKGISLNIIEIKIPENLKRIYARLEDFFISSFLRSDEELMKTFGKNFVEAKLMRQFLFIFRILLLKTIQNI